ncbi:MAG TPA: hypothetical protein VGA20_00520 [Gemmatimonadales bacterium]
MRRVPSFYTLSLLAGALLVGVAGVRHPLLQGDGAAQLATIAATPGWRGIHLSLVFGIVLVVAGLVGVALKHGETAGSAAARAGILLGVLGYGTALVGVLVMSGSATRLAAAYMAAQPGLAATEAVFFYDMIRPFAAMALRVGEFGIGLSMWSFGWAVWDGRVLPRWLGMVGVLAGVACTVWAVVVNEEAARLMGGLALVTVWQLAVAAWFAARETQPA